MSAARSASPRSPLVSKAKCRMRRGVFTGVKGRACTSPSTAARNGWASSRAPSPSPIRTSALTLTSLVPGLHHGLARDLAALELRHGRTEHLGSVRIGAGLSEGEAVAVGEPGLDLMGHGTAAHVV